MTTRGVIVLFAVGLAPAGAIAQNLDDAVSDQLRVANSQECDLLLGGDNPFVVLTGELLTICTRGAPAGGSLVSSASGGGAGTPTSASAVVEELLREKPERGFFATFEYESADRDVTEFEDGYDSDAGRLIVGVDFARAKWVLGAALEATAHDGDFRGGGDFQVDTYSAIGFASRRFAEEAGVHLYLGYGASGNDRRRQANFTQFDSFGQVDFEANGMPRADFDAQVSSAGAAFGYDFAIDNVTFTPRIGFDYAHTEYDTYSEFELVDSGLALTFHDDSFTSLLSSIGLEGSVSISTKFGVVMIQESAIWRHEFDDEQRDVEVSFVEDLRGRRFTYMTEPPDEDFVELSGGVVFVVGDRLHLFANYAAVVSHAYLEPWVLSLGFRRSF